VTQTSGGKLDAVVRRLPLFSLVGFVLMSIVAGVIATVFYDPARTPHPGADGPRWLDGLFQNDSGWYSLIAKDGYSYTPGQQSPIAFFPAYPLVLRVVGLAIGRDYVTAAGLVTLVSGAGVVMLFAAWVRTRVQPLTALVAVGILMLYPYSFFLYGTGYAESTYLLTVLGAFALLERRLYLPAAIVGAMATGGRPVGVAVTVGLVVRAIELLAQDRAARRADPVLVESGVGASSAVAASGGRVLTAEAPAPGIATPTYPDTPRGAVPLRELIHAVRFARWREVSLLGSLGGLVAWMIYLQVRFGDPVAFATVQEAPGWDQRSGPHTWFKVLFFERIARHEAHVFLLAPQILATLLAVLLLRLTWKRFGWGYLAYSVVSLAIPIIGTKDFMGSGRYVMSAFPVLAAAAIFLTDRRRPKWLAPAVLIVSFFGLCIITAKFVTGLEVS